MTISIVLFFGLTHHSVIAAEMCRIITQPLVQAKIETTDEIRRSMKSNDDPFGDKKQQQQQQIASHMIRKTIEIN